MVTAAHCLGSQPSYYTIRYGSSGERQLAIVEDYKIHESYSALNNGHDIAILTFNTNLPDELSPVNIASINSISKGTPIFVAGYGSTSENDQSQESLLRQTTSSIDEIDTFNRVIIQITGQQQGSCYGDSGGPVYISSGEKLEVIGATSWGDDCDRGDGVYSDVTQYQGWMKCNFAEMGFPLDSLINDKSSQECVGDAAKFANLESNPNEPQDQEQGNENILPKKGPINVAARIADKQS